MLCDDQALFRDGLRMLLSLQVDLEIVGEAENGAAAVELAHSLKPDVVIMDLRMPGMKKYLRLCELALVAIFSRISPLSS